MRVKIADHFSIPIIYTGVNTWNIVPVDSEGPEKPAAICAISFMDGDPPRSKPWFATVRLARRPRPKGRGYPANPRPTWPLAWRPIMPRLAVKTTEVYLFDELDDDAKRRARDWWRECEAQEFWFETEDAVTCANILGIEISDHVTNMGKSRSPNIYWSHSWSQGDGAMFMGHYKCAKDAPEKIREHAPKDEVLHSIADGLLALQAKHFGLLFADITRNGHHYSHSGCMSVEMGRYDDERGMLATVEYPDATEESLRHWSEDEKELTRLLRSFADWIFEQVKAEWEYVMSDENVDDSIKINEYEFTVEGHRA